MKLSKFIKQYRLSKNLKQSEFAELCGLDQSRIAKIELNQLPIGFETIKKLAKATGKSEEEIRKML